jgi:hypothetical protein
MVFIVCLLGAGSGRMLYVRYPSLSRADRRVALGTFLVTTLV